MNGYLAPSCTVTLGTQQWTTQMLRIEAALEAAPGIDVVRG